MPRSTCVEVFCLQTSSSLEQIEGPWLQLMETGDPECVATALRLYLAHLQMTITQLQPAMVITEAEQALQHDHAAIELWP